MEFPSISIFFTKAVFETVGIFVLALIGHFATSKLVKLIVKQVDDGDDTRDSLLEKRANTLGSIAKSILYFAIWSISLMMILSSWGINIAPILAGAGIIGLAVGFGAQTLVKDVVNGFFIIFENQFNVGDKVKIADKEGKVIAINIRTTVLKDKEGNIHIIPNSKITVITKF